MEKHYGELMDGGNWWVQFEINSDYAARTGKSCGEKLYSKVIAWQFVADDRYPDGRLIAWFSTVPPTCSDDYYKDGSAWVINAYDQKEARQEPSIKELM